MTDANKPTPSARQSKNIWIAIADGKKVSYYETAFYTSPCHSSPSEMRPKLFVMEPYTS
jgi:hypothetical protein